MTKKILATLFAVAVLLAAASSVDAQQYGQGAYGQGVVLGKGDDVEIVHEVKEAGLRENLAVAGGLLVAASGYFYRQYKKEASFI